MVCIYCGGSTQVVNSRHQKRSNKVWRRRTCISCKATFSTLEAAEYTSSIRVETKEAKLVPFSRDKLFVSVLTSCGHRQDPVEDASELASTIIDQLLKNGLKDGIIDFKEIVRTTHMILNRFDNVASVHYEALHKI
jgi:transcriptional repressor NrdR